MPNIWVYNHIFYIIKLPGKVFEEQNLGQINIDIVNQCQYNNVIIGEKNESH